MAIIFLIIFGYNAPQCNAFIAPMLYPYSNFILFIFNDLINNYCILILSNIDILGNILIFELDGLIDLPLPIVFIIIITYLLSLNILLFPIYYDISS